jgi:hypothetical protein
MKLLHFEPKTIAPPQEERPRNLPALGCIFLCALAAVVPLMVRGNSFGHDFDFHLLSWMETAKHWREGVVYPHWAANSNFGAGEPRFIFYPPATWMLGALLGTLTSWTIAPGLFILLALFLCGVSLLALAREYMPPAAATCAACIYIVNPYVLFNVYERSAYGELLAGAWMPLIVLYALRRRSSIAPLAVAFAGIWLTNAPAGVIAGYALVGVAVVAARFERGPGALLRAGFGGVLGLGLAAFYLVPAAYERRWVEIARAVGPEMRVEDSFLFERGVGDFHTAVLRTASWIAVVVLVISAMALTWAWRMRRSDKHGWPLLAASTAITIVVLYLLTPWSEFVWRAAPEMRFLQFPWRWLLLQSVVMAVMVGYALRAQGKFAPRALMGVAAIGCLAAMVVAGMMAFYQPEDEDDPLAAQIATFRSGAGVEGTDEYTPLGADNSAIPRQMPEARLLAAADSEVAGESLQANVEVDRWQSEHKVVQVQTGQAGFAVLRLMDYPGWQVLVNSSEHTLRPRRADGLMAVPIPAGRSRIEVKWRPTPDAIWGRVATFASLLVLMPVALLEGKRGLPTQV